LSIAILHQIHASITEDTLEDVSFAGRFRRNNEPIAIIDDADGRILHTPPRAEQLRDRIQALCNYANSDDNQEFTHPVIKAIVLHFWLAYDHPYIDGNGRTARALFYWYLLSRKYWLLQYLSISRAILKANAQYKRSFLYSETDQNDMTYFIMYNLKAIRFAINEVSLYLSKRQKEIREAMKLVKNIPGLNFRQYSLLRHALRHQDTIYHFKTHMNMHGITYQTARTDILELEQLKLLERIPTKRIFTFVASQNLLRKIKKHFKKEVIFY
jgi:Fic family protein